MDYSSLSLFVTPGFVGFDWPEYNLDTNQISASLGKGKWTVLADRVDAWQEWHRENKDRHESKSKITNRISGDPCTWSDNYPSLLIATSVDAPVHFKLQPTRYRHHDLKSTPMMGVPHRLKNRSGTHKSSTNTKQFRISRSELFGIGYHFSPRKCDNKEIC